MRNGIALPKKLIIIMLSLALVFLGVFSFMSIDRLQGNAKVINYAGVVRGATQRLVKEELQGYPNDELIEHLDCVIEELLTGEGDIGLIRLEDKGFQALMVQMKENWTEIKEEITKVRQGTDSQKLYRLSETYFELADRTVTEAEKYSEENVRKAEQGFLILTVIVIVVAGLLAWLGSVQEKRQKAIREAEDANKKKSERLSKMSKELKTPMNEISELIYVADMENYELLFVNDAGKKSFHVDDITGLKCYKSLQGRDTPCPFCTNALLKPDENYNWEFTNPITKCHYMLKDRIIEWEGRKARLEIAFDMTQVENEKQRLQYALDAEYTVTECIRTLYKGRDLKEDIETVLQNIGEFLQGDRTYIIEIKGELIYEDYEWCAKGIKSQKGSINGMSAAIFDRWMPILKRQECINIEDVEEYRESSPEEYAVLKAQGISSLVVAPMEREGVLVGCLGVDNPPTEKLRNMGPLLQSLCYFILLAYRRAENEQQLSKLSFHDTLTSFYNRNRYMKDLEVLSHSGEALGIVYLDVNGLKEINDQWGHAYGDEILVETAEKIRKVFREADCYRVGGDEFVVICKGVQKDKFEEQTENLKRSFKWDDRCNAAIGTQWADGHQDVEQIIADADAGMYEDKKEFYRKNRSLNRYRHQSDEVLQLADPAVLREGINRRQFVVYLQPKVSSSDRTAVGAEALIRYQSRDGALVLPGNFLPILEESKTISQIDFYVFELVCSKIKGWLQDGKVGFPISVNFSRYSLIQPLFVQQLKAICQKYSISPEYLEIEITETVRDVEGVDIKQLISSLRMEGFAVAIDDFGTEYANLAFLSEVEFDVLKLDRSMVKNIAKNHKVRTIIEAIASICKKTGIHLVAEGIEDEEQLEILQSCGVDTVQGFLFCKPISIEEYEERYT